MQYPQLLPQGVKSLTPALGITTFKTCTRAPRPCISESQRGLGPLKSSPAWALTLGYYTEVVDCKAPRHSVKQAYLLILKCSTGGRASNLTRILGPPALFSEDRGHLCILSQLIPAYQCLWESSLYLHRVLLLLPRGHLQIAWLWWASRAYPCESHRTVTNRILTSSSS